MFSVRVTGKYDRHLGGHWAFGSVTVKVEPSASFEVVDDLPEDEGFRENGYLDWAIFGLLDVLMTNGFSPTVKIKVTVEAAEYCNVDSSQFAFRLAGRDAGQKALVALEERQRDAMRERPEAQKNIVRLSK
jgi:hypothetical protein